MNTGRWLKKQFQRPRPQVFDHYLVARWFEPSREEECGGLTLTQGDIDWFRAKYRHPFFIGDSVTRDFTKVFADVFSPMLKVTDFKGQGRKSKYLYIVYSENTLSTNATARDYAYFRFRYTRRYEELLEFLKRRPVPDLLFFNTGLHFTYPESRQAVYEGVNRELLDLLHKHAPNATFVWTDTSPPHNSKKPLDQRMKQTPELVEAFNRRARALVSSHPVYKPERDVLIRMNSALSGDSGYHYSSDGTHWKPIVDIVRTALTVRLLREKEAAGSAGVQ